MPLPQDIRPIFQDIQDTLVRSDAPWVRAVPLSSVKVLWVGRETGTWASLHQWKKGYVAPRISISPAPTPSSFREASGERRRSEHRRLCI